MRALSLPAGPHGNSRQSCRNKRPEKHGPNENSALNPQLIADEILHAVLRLASVGHPSELPAFFPWFLFVPWDRRIVMIVRILDESCVLLCRA